MEADIVTFVGLPLPRPLSLPSSSTTNYHVLHSSDGHEHTSIPVFLSSSISTIPTRRNCPANHRARCKFSMACRNSTNCNMVLHLQTPFIKSNIARSPLWTFFYRNTSGFPAQITNPIGQIILGFNESNSLNLNFSECVFFSLRMSRRQSPRPVV